MHTLENIIKILLAIIFAIIIVFMVTLVCFVTFTTTELNIDILGKILAVLSLTMIILMIANGIVESVS